ncbi:MULTISPECIES: stage III sporulation protein AF [unclassified Clostridioides]|uniref:stage III sporulation protein AF n=1 Tax=unclassified Clostridioides TaxID=2635829 RepID=UPI0006BBC973|nr:stage III sporulation protein AF [Clostridioides difficile]MCC0691215.1 stage III sporulation protein AF [Clostridioides sp. ZZV14-6387]KPI54333.1 stage III sporulation protein AF [Clostridioides difficile]MCI9975332.1 stage III sporulation protein AF [Clostridioides difficile]MDB3085041.1 stage III sporulation protein AF [Clostridioides difficile]
MLEGIKAWIVSVLIGAFIVNIVDMILPSSKIKPYVNLVLNFMFVFIVITPVVGFFSKDMSLEDRILKSMGNYNKQYVDSTNALAKETGNNSLSKGYEDGLKEVLKLKLDEYGYDLEDIELNGANINNIKIKEKNDSTKSNGNIDEENKNNSTKEDEENINSNDKENSKQVFKKGTEYELNLNENKLKNDLIKVLDVSIEDIQIDK